MGFKLVIVLILCVWLPFYTCQFDDESSVTTSSPYVFNFTFLPHELEQLNENNVANVEFNLSCTGCPAQDSISFTLDTKDNVIASILENSTVVSAEWDPGEQQWKGVFFILGKRLGLTQVRFRHGVGGNGDDGSESDVVDDSFRVIVARQRTRIDDAYRYGIISFSMVIYLGFGAQLDLKVIWAILKKPVAPAIGAGCQFIIMPLVRTSSNRLITKIIILSHVTNLF